MDIQRTLIWIGLAIVSYLMVLAWNDDYNTAAQPVAQAQVSPALEANAELQPEAGPASAEFATPEEQGTATLNAPAANLENASAGQIEILTDVLRIVIDRRGGNIVQADLLKYQETRESKQALTLLQQSPLRTYVTEASLIGRDGPDNSRNGPMPIYESAASRYELKDGSNELSVDLTHRLSNGVDIIKRYTFGRDRYKIDVSFHVHNKSENPWQGNFAGKLVRDMSADPTAQGGMGMHSFLGLVVNTPTEPYEKFDFADLEKSPLNQTVQGGWLAFLQHYFLSAWVPPADQTHQFQSIRRGNLHVMGFVSPALTVEPGTEGELKAQLYVGPKIVDRLEAVAPNLDRTIDYGFLFFIASPLFWLLEWFHSLVGNWGIAIILLTVTIKAMFFHLSATSYRSMANMRRVAPQLTRLKELYGDDRQRMSQEMMNLYRKEKINPLGGCLPILVQMPVFIALYWVLFESVQLRHAPFFGWIQDLAVMDPYFILPILMGGTMFIQMSLNPTPPDPVQAKVMKMMPIIFTVFFLWFPAGLVLYWLVNNVLSIAQQWYITRQIEQAASKTS